MRWHWGTYTAPAGRGRVVEAGLGGNSVWSILQDQKGALWFGTTQRATRYRPVPPSSPPIYIDAIVADCRYEGEKEISIPASVRRLNLQQASSLLEVGSSSLSAVRGGILEHLVLLSKRR